MAGRDPLLQSSSSKGGLEFRAQLYRPPLLPFEKQLIELIGCTEDEYRFFAAEAIRRGRVRPAGYEHIPDIQMDATTIAIISLVVGLASSAASYLLAPKPKAIQPASNQQVTSQQLDSISGASRFTPTFGFDSQAQLATYGDPIPLIFGRYTGSTGGMLVSPKLVWSRMFSYGTQQGIKLLFIVGEQGYDGGQALQGLAQPSLDAIFLGNTPLDAIYANEFAFYWRRDTTLSSTGRIRAEHLRYGTRATAASGDPETFVDIFSCPTARAENDYGFSSAHQLSNNRSFGCYGAIPNGTGYRVNWRIVSIPAIGNTYENDPKGTLHAERVKVAGIANPNFGSDEEYREIVRADGMNGVGRNWSRRMGIIAYNGQRVSLAEGNRVFAASVGVQITFKISAKQLNTDFFGSSGVNVDDINSALNEERISADDALQIGEIFMIADTVWKVVDRTIPQWRPEDRRDQLVTLECIETIVGQGLVGVVCEEALELDYLWDRFPNQLGMNTAFFPLQKVSFATIRNTRPCEITEIGIKSRVYQRLNGICNFQSLPTPTQLALSDNDRVNLQSGTIATYVRRASAFTVHVRPAGFQEGTTVPFEWRPIPENFVVVGNQPVDVYNFLRIRHPAKYRWEFRIIPKNGADFAFNDSGTAQYWLLNANASIQNAGERSILSSTYQTSYGPFTVSGVGTLVTKSAIKNNTEFTTRPVLSRQNFTATIPEQISSLTPLPEDNGITEAVAATKRNNYVIQPNAGYPTGFRVAFAFQLFGSADTSPLPEGGVDSKVVRHNVESRWIEIRYSYIKTLLPANHWSGQTYCWIIQDHSVVASSNNWTGVKEFSTWTAISASNPFRTPPGFAAFEYIGEYHTITGMIQGPLGRTQAFLEEIHGPARDQNIGFQKTSAFVYSSNNKQVTLKITSTVVYVEYHWSGVKKQWSGMLTQVDTATPTNTTNWVIGDRFNVLRTVASTNPFFQAGQQVGYQFVVDSLTTVSSGFTETISAERIFDDHSQYADISSYGSLVEKSNANDAEHSVAYVNEIVANTSSPNYDRLTVCGLALKASRNFTGLDQLRVWLPTGIPVVRFHPDDGGNLPLTDTSRLGPSNLFTDLVYYLLTDTVAGMGRVLGITPTDPQLINTDDLVTTAKFLKANKLFFDGAITSPTNLRQFIADRAPYFLCNFVISDGKFSLLPAVPTTAAGEISVDPVEIKQLFTSGNIIEDSFSLEYVPAEERKPFQAIVRFREEAQNQLPQERNVSIRWADDTRYAAVESFDLTDYCTSYQHAELVGRFFLSIRKRITHTIRFRTLPYGINLAPGDFIRVSTEASPYSAAQNGSINAQSGAIVSATEIVDGRYTILYYQPGTEEVSEGVMTVSAGKALETALYGAIFTLFDATVSENVYMVEQLTLDEDGTVQVTASEFPCDSRRSSLLAQDLLPQNRGRFVVEI